MPTGYTAMIDDNPDLTTAKWVTQGLARAYGVCVILRDHPFDLTEEQVEKILKDYVVTSTKYHRERLLEIGETIEQIEGATEKSWQEDYETEVKRITDWNNRSIATAEKHKRRHSGIKLDLIKLREETTDETTKNLAQFGLDQLNVVKRQTEPYLSPIPNITQFKTNKRNKAYKDLDYHTEEIKKTEKRERERLAQYRLIQSEVKRVLGE